MLLPVFARRCEMRRTLRCALLLVVVAGCANTPTGGCTLTVTSNTVLAFDATYRVGNDWARVLVRYSPNTTFYNLTTSMSSLPLAYAGTVRGDPSIVQAMQKDARYG